MMSQTPTRLIFLQHGLSDSIAPFQSLARQLPSDGALICTPKLDRLHTWLHMKPLIDTTEDRVAALLTAYPQLPVRAIGHSMGGLIWLELLQRHPEWHARVEYLTLVASPVAGATLARGIDPFGWGLGVARDLAQDRRALAEQIASAIPTLVIAGERDRIVPPTETRVAGARWLCLPTLNHETIRDHQMTARMITRFWDGALDTGATNAVIVALRRAPGIKDAHPRDLPKAQLAALLSDGGALRTWTNPLGYEHVFVVDHTGDLRFGGFVRPNRAAALRQMVAQLGHAWGA
jgi:pimeloyl-ACP methyl ester carboxylesterase